MIFFVDKHNAIWFGIIYHDGEIDEYNLSINEAKCMRDKLNKAIKKYEENVLKTEVYAQARHSLIEIEKLQDSEDCLFPGFAYLESLRRDIKNTLDRMKYGLIEPSKAKEEIIEYHQLALHREMA